jgi:hypothetical protein
MTQNSKPQKVLKSAKIGQKQLKIGKISSLKMSEKQSKTC